MIKPGCPSPPLAWNYVLRLSAHGLLMIMMKMMMRVMMMMVTIMMMRRRMMIVKILVTLILIKIYQMSRLRVRSLLGSQVELACTVPLFSPVDDFDFTKMSINVFKGEHAKEQQRRDLGGHCRARQVFHHFIRHRHDCCSSL